MVLSWGSSPACSREDLPAPDAPVTMIGPPPEWVATIVSSWSVD
nr:hypothetical protein [Acrocarpospora catenulata]